MKPGLFLIFTFTTCGHLFAQEKTSPPCDFGDRIYTKAEYAPTYGNNLSDLQVFFDSAFNSIKKKQSKLSLTLIIDTIGKASVSSVDYYVGPSTIDEATFKAIINTMPNWNPGRMNNCNVKTAVSILLALDKKSVLVSYHKSQTSKN